MTHPDTIAAGRGRATMRDVAALAGVGIKTVSRVFNDVPTVDARTGRARQGGGHKLGYRPNLTAASLRRTGGRTNTIGLLLEDVSNPYSSAVHRAVEDYARARGVLVLAASVDEEPAARAGAGAQAHRPPGRRADHDAGRA